MTNALAYTDTINKLARRTAQYVFGQFSATDPDGELTICSPKADMGWGGGNSLPIPHTP